MIFGKKSPSLNEIEAKQAKRKYNWFAWRPMHLEDGRWIWMQLFWREWWSCHGQCGFSHYINQKDEE
jgi:hypothetical protein